MEEGLFDGVRYTGCPPPPPEAEADPIINRPSPSASPSQINGFSANVKANGSVNGH
jgi:hypothetical protein